MNKKIDFMRQGVLEMRKRFISGETDYIYMEEISEEEFMQRLEKLFFQELKMDDGDGTLNDIYNELDGGTQEKEAYSSVIEKIKEKMFKIENYVHDLWADFYMALLRTDPAYDIQPDELMERGWESRACNKKINMENVRRHYPLVDYGDEYFPISGIPGGCQEYHSLMMRQENIGIFDVGSKTESLKKYAFPKTHDIYHELAGASIENRLLLEKTLGAGYADQCFCYLKGCVKKEQVESLKVLIGKLAEMPMFIRKDITDEIGLYLRHFKCSDTSVKCVESTVDVIVYIVQKSYKKIWQCCWHIYNKERKFPMLPLKDILQSSLKKYFDEIKYNICALLNRQGVCMKRDPDEDFYSIKRNVIKYDGGLLLDRDSRENQEILDIYEQLIEETQCAGKSIDIDAILKQACDEYAKQVNSKVDKIDPRRKTENLDSMDVYARIHEYIVESLN